MDESLNELGESIVGALPGAVSGYTVALGELTIHAEAAAIVSVLTMLRDDPRFLYVNFIGYVPAWIIRHVAKRFDVVCHLLSPKFNRRIRVKVQTDEATPVPSTIDGLSRRRTGSSARPTISTESCSPAIPTCAAFLPTTASRGTRCARISR